MLAGAIKRIFPPRPDFPPEVREFQTEVARGLRWRFGFLLIDLVLLLWLTFQLNAMRLYTIEQAPSYVPTSVIQYWLASGAVMGAGAVLIGELLAFGRRMSAAAARRFPTWFPFNRPQRHPVPFHPPRV